MAKVWNEEDFWKGEPPTDYTEWGLQKLEEKHKIDALRRQREMEALQRDKPRFGTFGTMSPEQMEVLRSLMGGQAPTFQPAQFGGLPTEFQPVGVGGAQDFPPVGVGGVQMPTAPRPTYGAMPLAGAGERGAMLRRMMGVSPGEEAAAIQAMSAPAMRQFREEILPMTRGKFLGEGSAWSTMRAGAEAKAGGGLAERLASMGEQHRMQRRGQAMQAGGISMQEALGAAQAGLTRYGTEMQPYMQAMGMTGQEAMQRQALGVQAGMGAQQLGAQSAAQEMQAQAQAGMQAQQLGAQAGLANLQAQMQAALQAQQLQAQAGQTREQMLAQLLGIPMMGVYSY